MIDDWGKDAQVAFDRLMLIIEAQERAFPKGAADPFKMITRLLEECGELAADVQWFEDEGLKRAKRGEPDPAAMTKEIMDVLTSALTIAKRYGLVEAVSERVEASISRAIENGHLPGRKLS